MATTRISIGTCGFRLGLSLAMILASACGGEPGSEGAFPGASGSGSETAPPNAGVETGSASDTTSPPAPPQPTPTPLPAESGSGDAVPHDGRFAPGVYYAAPGESLTRIGDGATFAHTGRNGCFDLGAETYVTIDADLLILASRDGKMRRVIKLSGVFAAAHPVLSPDESLVVFEARAASNQGASEDFDLWSIELQDAAAAGTTPKRLTLGPANERGAAWLSQTRRIAYAATDAAGDGSLHVYDLAAAREVLLIRGLGPVTRVAVSPDDAEIFAPEAMRGFALVGGTETRDLSSVMTTPGFDAAFVAAGDALIVETRVAGTVGPVALLYEVALDGSKASAVGSPVSPAVGLCPQRRP